VLVEIHEEIGVVVRVETHMEVDVKVEVEVPMAVPSEVVVLPLLELALARQMAAKGVTELRAQNRLVCFCRTGMRSRAKCLLPAR
jgi:hypothetical protein